MPQYSFKCNACQQVTEAFFPIADGPATAVLCKCGGEAFRIYDAVAVAFKGTGWGKDASNL